MKLLIKLSLIIFAVAVVVWPARGATLSGAGTRETLIEQEYLGYLTIGADYQQQQRDVSASSQGKMRLTSQTIDGYIGVDPWDWLMIFATFGGSAAKVGNTDGYNQSKFKWSGGFDVNWWRYSIQEPTFLEGDLSLKTHAEFAMSNSGSGAEKIDWNEILAALLVNYEIFVSKKNDHSKYPYSLALYAGPALSWLDGSYYANRNMAQKNDFHEEHLVGVVGGAEVFAAYNLSIGAAVQYYDAVTVNVGLRYHF
jgi:opacity protein-like surface antigen